MHSYAEFMRQVFPTLVYEYFTFEGAIPWQQSQTLTHQTYTLYKIVGA